MKRLQRVLTTSVTAGLLAAAFVVDAQAVQSDALTLTVTIGNQLSVLIRNGSDADRPSYDFGTMNYGDVSINRSGVDEIRIDNNGGVTSTYQLSIFDAAGGLAIRTDTTALADNEYRVQALFQDAQPGHANFADPTASATDTLTAVPKNAQVTGANSQFSKDSGTSAAEDGVAVLADNRLGGVSEVKLWLRLSLAATGGATGLQTAFATVYVNAT